MFADILDPVSVVAVSTEPVAQKGRLADGAAVRWLARTDTFRAVHMLVPPRSIEQQLELTDGWALVTIHDTTEFGDTVMADRLEHLRAKAVPVTYQTGETTRELLGAAGSPSTRYRGDTVTLVRFDQVNPGDEYVDESGVVKTATRTYTFDDTTTVYGGAGPHQLVAGPGVPQTTKKSHHLVGRVGGDPAAVWLEEQVREGRKFAVVRVLGGAR